MINILKHLLLSLVLVSLNAHAQPGIKVSVKPFSEIAHSRTFSIPGRVINLSIAQVAAETSGRILQFDIRVGERVERGQTLVELDCREAITNRNRVVAGLKRLQAKKQLTQQQLKRAKSLQSSRSISRDELDQRQTQLDADNASIEEQSALLETANKSVQDCELKAPYSGTLIEKMTNTGSYASPGMPIFTLLKEDEVELEVEVTLKQLKELERADNLVFSMDDESYPIKLRSKLPVINHESLLRKIRLVFTGKDYPLGGSYGLVNFESERSYLSDRYIQKRDGHFGVFVLRDNKAHFLKLPNAEAGQSVNTPLMANDQVIIDQLNKLQPMDPVEVSE